MKELEDIFGELRDSNETVDADALLGIMDRLDISAVLSEFRQQFSEDSAFRARVLDVSSVHPNGFVRIAISEPGSKRHLRVHFWRSAGDGEGTDIHDHRWAFASRVLTGAILVNEYAEEKDGVVKATLYEHVDTRPVPLARVSERRLSCVSSRIVRAGSSYFTPPTVLHDVVAADNDSSTVVLEGPRIGALSHVYKRDATDPKQFATPLTESDIASILDHLIDATGVRQSSA